MGSAVHQREHEPESGQQERGRPSPGYSDAGVPPQDLAELMARTARELDSEHGADATIHALVAAAVETIPGAQSAGITEVHQRGREIEVSFASDQLVVKLDSLQHEVGEGPCLDAAFQHRTVRIDDFATESRWPQFAPRAHQLGAGSLLSLQLYVDGDDLAALNVYSRHPRAFTDQSEQVGLLFASHAAIAMAGARREQQIRAAIDNRDIIGQAKGILMERFKLTPDQAFSVLVRASSETNIKLRDIAYSLAGSGELPKP